MLTSSLLPRGLLRKISDKLKQTMDRGARFWLLCNTLLITHQRVSRGWLAWPAYQYRTPIDHAPFDSSAIANSADQVARWRAWHSNISHSPVCCSNHPPDQRRHHRRTDECASGAWVTQGRWYQLRAKTWLTGEMQPSYSARVVFNRPKPHFTQISTLQRL